MGDQVIDAQEIDVQQLQDTVLAALSDGVYFVDRSRRILFWNDAAERLSGFSAADMVGRCCADGRLSHVDHTGTCLCARGCPLQATMQDGLPRAANVFLHHADGHRVPVSVRAAPIRNKAGEIIGSIEVFSDDTDRVSALEQIARLEQDAMFDELTGIANRRFFRRAIEAAMARYERHDARFAVMMLDVDHFKTFNDTHGHDIGDKVLQLVSRTLAQSCRAYDTPARWGGEEFIVLLQYAALEQLAAAGERFRALVAASTLEHEAQEMSVTVSVGACGVEPADTAETLIKRADALLYASKAAGRNRVTVR